MMMKRMSSRELIKAVQAAGWRLNRVKGSHHIFTHPTLTGALSIVHPEKDVPLGTLRATLKKAGLL